MGRDSEKNRGGKWQGTNDLTGEMRKTLETLIREGKKNTYTKKRDVGKTIVKMSDNS